MKINYIKFSSIGAIAAITALITLNAKDEDLPPEDGSQPCFEELCETPHMGRHMSGEKGHGGIMKRGPKDPGRMLLMMSHRLDLTDQQEDQILDLSQSYKGQFESLREKAKKGHETLREMRENETFDEKSFRSAMAVVQPAMVEGKVLHEKYRSELEAILTAEQLGVVKEMKEKMRKHRKHTRFGKKGEERKGKRSGEGRRFNG